MALLNALAYSTSLTHLIYIFFSKGEENLQVLGRSSGAWGSSPKAGGHGQVWGRVLWLPCGMDLTGRGGLAGCALHQTTAMGPTRGSAASCQNSHLHLLSSAQGSCCPGEGTLPAPVPPWPLRGGGAELPHSSLLGCAHGETHTCFWDPGIFFILAQNSSRDDYLKDESPNTIAKTHP